MATQLLATELANLIHESKRKNHELRQAAEASLEVLKHLENATEQIAAEQLSQKPNFVDPFIIACSTKNAKFVGIATVCLQRLVYLRALPHVKLDQILESFLQASSAGVDVQLKILQALPSLLQNYASDIKGDLLVSTLNVCFQLQSSKNAIVNNTAAATLQQLLVAVFDKVVVEDKDGTETSIAGQAPTIDGQVELYIAALDACRVFNDLCLMTENQRPYFLQHTGLQQTFGLELVESVLTNHASIFNSHPEQLYILKVRVLPLIISALKGNPSFASSVRLVRVLYTVLRRHMNVSQAECAEALEVLTHLLDQDAVLWKRALCMEALRGIFTEQHLVRGIYMLKEAEDGKSILKVLTDTFVRLSTEKPNIIGLGHQSAVPAQDIANASNSQSDRAMLDASGVAGIIGGPLSNEVPTVGISTQWSVMRVPCIDQLDKSEPPFIPESYIYSLILACIASLSDGLAKFIPPLTMPGRGRTRRNTAKDSSRNDSAASSHLNPESSSAEAPRDSSASMKRQSLPINPLEVKDHPMHAEVGICAAIVDDCWPAILATCSTFLYSVLDHELFHGLVRSFQRFTQVAGLLQLVTPRDAFLTTLGKSAVPPSALTACRNLGSSRPATPTSQGDTASFFSNARDFLSSDSLISPSTSEKQRQTPADAIASLDTRNLLCLRALLNLGIALGPTLGPAWDIIFQTLQQADFVLSVTGTVPGRTQSVHRGTENAGEHESGLSASSFGNEVRSVRTTAKRLVESSVEFPSSAFTDFIGAIASLLDTSGISKPRDTKAQEQKKNLDKPGGSARRGPHLRLFSFSSPIKGSSTQEMLFAIVNLGEAASTNLERLLSEREDDPGWTIVSEALYKLLSSPTLTPQVRVKAAETFVQLMLEISKGAVSMPKGTRGPIQRRVLQALREALVLLQHDTQDTSVADLAAGGNVQRIILDGLRSMIDGSGENLVDGWDVVFDIIRTVFERRLEAIEELGISSANVGVLASRSTNLVRSSFSSLQLICSDFLECLPKSCFLTLVDTLYSFCSQDEDLNIALTTINFFWVLSDFSSSKGQSLHITAEVISETEGSGLENLAGDRNLKGSDAALWMLLLRRLTAVATDQRLELRNSAIQTFFRIFDSYGDRLTAEAWFVCTNSLILKLLRCLEDKLNITHSAPVSQKEQEDWRGTMTVVLDGISSLFANYLETLTTHSSFDTLWHHLLDQLGRLLRHQSLEISTSIFEALSHILSQAAGSIKRLFSDKAVDSTWELWSHDLPISKQGDSAAGDTQKCLTSYVVTFEHLYTLTQQRLTMDRLRRTLNLLRQAVQTPVTNPYVLDVDKTTPLQSQILAAVQMITTDMEGAPSAIIKQLAAFVTMAYERDEAFGGGDVRQGLTFIALSKAATRDLQDAVLRHASRKEIYDSHALATALEAVHKPIKIKYSFRVSVKAEQPWRLATSAALEMLTATLPRLSSLDVSPQVSEAVWTRVVSIADGILSADMSAASPDSRVEEDENFDVESYRKLHCLIIPALGDSVQEKLGEEYIKSLFQASIIHALTPAEAVLVEKEEAGAFSKMCASRLGRTSTVPPRRRSRMSYIAFEELFSLVSSSRHEGSESAEHTTTAGVHLRLARAAAPFMLLRCAITLRGFVADQPLRGKMPQPLSQRKELIWMLRKLVELQSEGEAIAPTKSATTGVDRVHLVRLYPLLVRALGVGKDEKVQSLLREGLEAVGSELSTGL